MNQPRQGLDPRARLAVSNAIRSAQRAPSANTDARRGRASGQGATDVEVDLTNATFIDASFLGVLLSAEKRLRKHDGRISIVCADRNLSKIFEITGLDRIFPILG
jgi:anti-anti-sigma factor